MAHTMKVGVHEMYSLLTTESVILIISFFGPKYPHDLNRHLVQIFAEDPAHHRFYSLG